MFQASAFTGTTRSSHATDPNAPLIGQDSVGFQAVNPFIALNRVILLTRTWRSALPETGQNPGRSPPFFLTGACRMLERNRLRMK